MSRREVAPRYGKSGSQIAQQLNFMCLLRRQCWWTSYTLNWNPIGQCSIPRLYGNRFDSSVCITAHIKSYRAGRVADSQACISTDTMKKSDEMQFRIFPAGLGSTVCGKGTPSCILKAIWFTLSVLVISRRTGSLPTLQGIPVTPPSSVS